MSLKQISVTVSTALDYALQTLPIWGYFSFGRRGQEVSSDSNNFPYGVEKLPPIFCTTTETVESFHPHMVFLFPFLRANDLRLSLLMFVVFYSLVHSGYKHKVSVQLVPKKFHVNALLIVFHAANEKTGQKQY